MATSPGRRCPTCGAPVRWKGQARVVECRYCQTHIAVGTWTSTPAHAEVRSLRPSSQRAFLVLTGALVVIASFVAAVVLISAAPAGGGELGTTTSSSVAPSALTSDGAVTAAPTATAETSATATATAAARQDELVRVVLEFGEQGDGPGQFEDPRQIAVAPSGDIFVADYSTRRVQRFDAAGKLEKAVTIRRGGQNDFITGLAADYDGNIWLTRGGNLLKYRIEPIRLLIGKVNRAPALSYGAVAIDPENRVYVQNYGATAAMSAAGSAVDSLRKLSKSGRLLDRWKEVASGPLTIDAQGTIYIADKSDPRIDVLDSSGRLTRSIGGRDQEGWDIGVISSVAADSRGRLFVLAGDVHVLTTAGEPLGHFSSKGARALAADVTGAIYSVTSYCRVIKYEVLLPVE